MNIIFDLDGTLALDDHRKHFILGEKKDWHSYFDACGLDEPNMPIIDTLKALYLNGHSIEIWTGRSEGTHVPSASRMVGEWRCTTLLWLLDQGIRCMDSYYPVLPERHHPVGKYAVQVEHLKMRPVSVYIPDVELKGRWLETAIKEGRKPDLVFEDRLRVVEWWREQDISCVQVAQTDT